MDEKAIDEGGRITVVLLNGGRLHLQINSSTSPSKWNGQVNTSTVPMPKQRKKRDLPTKICVQCGRPFTWRKKWEKVWEEVKYCSERCRREKS